MNGGIRSVVTASTKTANCSGVYDITALVDKANVVPADEVNQNVRVNDLETVS